MTEARSRQIARERLRIRLALDGLGIRPASELQRSFESLLAALAASDSNKRGPLPSGARRQIERSIGPRALADLERAMGRFCIAGRESSPNQMAAELGLIEWGCRVLELEESGKRRGDALDQASQDLGPYTRKGETQDAARLFERFRDFKKLVEARGFVAYFSIDPTTGEFALT